MPPRYGDSASPYLNVSDLFNVLSFKYLMINWGGGGGSQMITPDHSGGRGGVSGGLKYDHEILEQPLTPVHAWFK